jgi:peptide/nickel transport system substrate-binding protein
MQRKKWRLAFFDDRTNAILPRVIARHMKMEARSVIRGTSIVGALRLGLALALLGSMPVSAMAQVNGRQFVIVIDQEPATLDPSFALSQPSAEALMPNIEDQLVGVDHDGKPAPTVATWTVSDGGKTVAFHVKPGIKFQSGDPLTAEDIAFSFNRTIANSANTRGIYRGNLDKVEVTDPMTVRFIFKTPNIGIIIDRSIYIGSKAYHDRVGEQTYFEHPNGTGPYKLVEYKRGQYADLEAFPGYHGRQPQVRRARLYFIKDDATRAAKLQSGEADLISSAPWNQIAALEKSGFRVVSALSFPFMAINFQTYNPNVPWSKLKVRQAIAHAIDGDAIAKGLLNGIPSRDPMLTPGELGYDKSLKPYSFDPALSKRLLAEAGFPNGFTMPLYWPQTYYGMRETAEAVALYLKAVGITVNVTQLETIQNQEMLGKQSKDPAFVYIQLRAMPFSNANDSAGQLYFTLSERATTATYKSSDPQFEKLTEEAITVLDPVKRGEIVRQATRLLYNDVGIIGLWHAKTQYAMKSNVSFTPIPHQYPMMHVQDISVK